jgi:hypothetical protein
MSLYLASKRLKGEILYTIKLWKVNWSGHILRNNCLPKHVEKWNIEGTRRGRSRKQLLDDIKETMRYWKIKEKALHRTVWRTHFGRSCEPIVRQTVWWWMINKYLIIINIRIWFNLREYVAWRKFALKSRKGQDYSSLRSY